MRIAWWPGHSTGRYAGSTWYADTFAGEIDEHCIAQLDIDSPGCEGATAYEEVMWMAEADAPVPHAIQDALGLPSERVRPLRAGDYSFNQIGPTGLYMLLSNIPIEERKRRGYYAVGGCGGNIAWHTPDDLMPVADLEILRNDLKVYLTTIVRILNAPLHPFDYTAAIDEVRAAVARYHEAAAGEVDFAPLLADLDAAATACADWRARAEAAVGAAGVRGASAAERGAAPRGAPARAAQLRPRRAVRPRPGAQVRGGAAAGGGRRPGGGAGRAAPVHQGGAGARAEQGARHRPGAAARAGVSRRDRAAGGRQGCLSSG